jgi:pimeloyl-ACP methyl ester carboxylesterase
MTARHKPILIGWCAVASLALLLSCGMAPAAEDETPEQMTALRTAISGASAQADMSQPAVRTNLPIARLALKKMELLSGEARGWRGTQRAFELLAKDGQEALARLRAGQVYSGKPGQLNELAYITQNDGTVQPYYLYLPPNYAPGKPCPLITFLHGYVPSISVLDPWVLPPEICKIAGDKGCLLLIPYGRRNTDFAGVGEVDVLAAMREVQDLYAVDGDRLYLCGASMGGLGAWRIGLHYPGMFAAITPISGQTDMFQFFGWSRDETPTWKRWLIEQGNAVDLSANLFGQHFFVQHGAMDSLVAASHSRHMAALARQQGTPLRYGEYPTGDHFLFADTACYESAWSWSTRYRLNRSPRAVELKTYSLQHGRAFWLAISRLEHWGQPATVHAEVEADGTGLKITSNNVRRLRIDSREAPLKPGKPWQVTLNGVPARVLTGGRGELRLPAEAWEGQSANPWPPEKRRGLAGPCEEVFNTRFLVVQGSAGDPRQNDILAHQVADWASEWDQYADGAPPVKTDAEVTEADIRGSNLVLFGTPQTNAILARIAPQLPFKIANHRFSFGGRDYSGPGVGLVACYPNPLAPAHYVLIYSGERYGERLSINHKHDLLPDFLVFTTEHFNADDTNAALCAGYFDVGWNVAPDLLWARD